MARTKQSARKSTSGAVLFYSKKKIRSPKKNVIKDDPGTKPAAKSKLNKVTPGQQESGTLSVKASSSSTAGARSRNGSSTVALAESWHGKTSRRSSTSSVTSLSVALSKLEVNPTGKGSGSPRSSVLSTNFFSNATRMLGVIKDLCEAFSGVSYVKGVAGLVQHIIEIADVSGTSYCLFDPLLMLPIHFSKCKRTRTSVKPS